MRRIAALSASLALLLAGCGGGVYLGWSWGDDDFGPPSVSITSAQASVPAGGTLRVVAAASDADSGIDEVAFYRVDPGADTRLGSTGRPPYEWNVPVPADGRSTLTVYARARDGASRTAESDRLTVSVTP
ncbi:Ig-like domain-containing protein [Piscinibacter sp.]|uniref:Ig-like domain-containing protein n=1 Tax=Piscinibacter sp. TaxID=1903157 RepID=UPI0039E563AB